MFVGCLLNIGFYLLVCRCSQNIHDISLVGLVQTSMRFFDTNPGGRILNRFAKDLGQVLIPIKKNSYRRIFDGVIP